MSDSVLSLSFVPVIAWEYIIVLGGVLLFLGVLGLVRNASGSILRLLISTVIILTLTGPRHQQEQRVAQDDVAIVVVDRSPSQLV